MATFILTYFLTYGCPSENTNPENKKFLTLLGRSTQSYADISDNTSGVNDIDASYYLYVLFLFSDR